MTTLLLSARSTEDNQALWRAADGNRARCQKVTNP